MLTCRKVYNNICDLIARAFIGVDAQFTDMVNRLENHRQNCFEVFGCDILIDSDLKPWQLEVNVGPSLNQDSEIDKVIKLPMITDSLNLIGMQHHKFQLKVLDFNLGEFLNFQLFSINVCVL